MGSRYMDYLYLYVYLVMTMSIMFWNVQGAASQSFRKTFKTIIQSYKSAMVVVMELQINGRKIDNFIKISGFDRSHRVEAEGFSGGIWLLWRDQFDVEIIFNHKQFIHLKLILIMC